MCESLNTTYPHEWLFKASWRATALTFKVGAANLKQAQKRAEGQVLRMLGGSSCMEINLIRQLK